jgi:AAA domain/Helix-turn-helix domain
MIANTTVNYAATRSGTEAGHNAWLDQQREQKPEIYSFEAIQQLLEDKAWQGAVREESQEYTCRYLQRLVKMDGYWYAGDFTEDWIATAVERFYRLRDERLNRPHVRGWLLDVDDFIKREVAPRESYLVDTETSATVFYQASINELFAFRGQGKSIIANALIRVLTQGGDWLRLRSPGGKKVLLVDGELPAAQLHERLTEFVGTTGRFKMLSPETMENPSDFPNLSEEEGQDSFLRSIDSFEPDVLIFDSLTRCFRFDTNDVEAWLRVNDFLVRLRGMGFCVILVHHAGKNGTARGLTTGDDNLDTSIKLDRPYAWQPGDGLAFKWTYEKVRAGGNLPGFEAAYEDGAWRITEDERLPEVMTMHRAGKSQRAIARELDMHQSTVSRLLSKAKAAGLDRLNHTKDAG